MIVFVCSTTINDSRRRSECTPSQPPLIRSTLNVFSIIFACCSRSPPASSPWIAVTGCSPAQSAAAPWSPRPAPPPAQQSPDGRQSAAPTDAPAAAPSSAAPPARKHRCGHTHTPDNILPGLCGHTHSVRV